MTEIRASEVNELEDARMAAFSLKASADRRFTLAKENGFTRLGSKLRSKLGRRGQLTRWLRYEPSERSPMTHGGFHSGRERQWWFAVEEHAGDDGVATFDASLDS